MAISIVFLSLLATAILVVASYWLIKILRANKKSGQPLLMSFILQRDDCSRLLGEFGDVHLHECNKLILVWQNGSQDIKVRHSASIESEDEAAILLIKASMLIQGACHG